MVCKSKNRWQLISERSKGSIHSVGAEVQGLTACNGWTFWHTVYKGSTISIDTLRTIAKQDKVSDIIHNFNCCIIATLLLTSSFLIFAKL